MGLLGRYFLSKSRHSKFTFKELVVDFSLTKIKGVSTARPQVTLFYILSGLEYFACCSNSSTIFNSFSVRE